MSNTAIKSKPASGRFAFLRSMPIDRLPLSTI